MAKIDDFGGPAHLAWTPPKSENIKNGLLICKFFGQYQKMVKICILGRNLQMQVDKDRKALGIFNFAKVR